MQTGSEEKTCGYGEGKDSGKYICHCFERQHTKVETPLAFGRRLPYCFEALITKYPGVIIQILTVDLVFWNNCLGFVIAGGDLEIGERYNKREVFDELIAVTGALLDRLVDFRRERETHFSDT